MKFSVKIFLFFAFLTIGGFLVWNFASLPKIGQPSVRLEQGPEIQKETIVSLSFDFGNGNIKTFNTLKLKEEKTVFELLKKVAKENNLELSFKEYSGLGVFIESIDVIRNSQELFWQFWVNSQYARVGASQYLLKNGDSVEWKYVKSQF